ncbi:MAG TPA: THUMP domain-containing protein [Candidatus Poseidoniia archaeon]|jgi:adenylyl- and sulfurtransferase ThiI|nr:THUMP domain-containing protein [Candidatus Poseidoniia archaeon]
MEGFVIKNSSRNNLKQIGDKIILNLIKKDVKAKYRIIGNYIFLETNEDIIYNNIIKQEIHKGKITTSKKEDIFEEIKELISIIEKPESFAIKVDRKGEHKYTSTELAKEVAGAPFEKWPNIKVDLDNPDLEINVQIINNRSIIYLRD